MTDNLEARLTALEERVADAESKLEAISEYVTLPPLKKGDRVRVDTGNLPKRYAEGKVVDFHYMYRNWFIDVMLDEERFGSDEMKVHIKNLEVIDTEGQDGGDDGSRG